MKKSSMTDRRSFMRRGAMGAGAMWALSLGELSARAGHGNGAIAGGGVVNGVSPYGPISPKLDQTTGLPLLSLPDGFEYKSYGWTGDVMADGVACPSMHDGMAVVDAWHDVDEPRKDHKKLRASGVDTGDDMKSGRIVLVRNHEGGAGPLYVGNRPDITYTPASGPVGGGGTTNLIFDCREGAWVSSWSSLAGTIRNCAGGVTPWGTWLTCEETGDAGHGWNFDVAPEGGDPTPLYDMGRFSHEAIMIDPKTGWVYETEDAGNSGLYLFIPHRQHKLERGGKLYMLAVRNQPNFNFGPGFAIGTKWDVVWVPIDDPRAATQSCFAQGWAKGGARFARLEGAWWGDRTGYFLSTSGGSVGEGQVFEYNPEDETVTLIYDAPNATDLDNPDNITVTPRGGLLLCEDAAGNHFTQGERLVGLTLHGQTFTFAMNNINLAARYNSVVGPGDYRQNEWAGACYSPDGNWLFVNIQTPGVTFAITGPWGNGPL